MEAFFGLTTLLTLCGCTTMSNLETAQTLRAGEWKVAAEGRYLLTASPLKSETLPGVDLSVRRGMTDAVELGVRVGSHRPELMGKFRLRDGEKDGGPTVSFSQTAGFWYFADGSTPGWMLTGRSALPIGFHFGRHELVLSPQLLISGGASRTGVGGFALYPTFSAAFSWRIWKWFGLLPQVSIGYPLLSVPSNGVVIGNGVILEGALAITFDTWLGETSP